MNKKTLVSILLASVMSVGLLAGCGASKVDTGNKKYVIACDSKFAPFSFE